MSANPLVAHEENPSTYAGIGILDSAIQSVDAISSGNWIDAGINTTTATLDSLAFVTNPAGALLSSGIGWLIEHVEALSEPLDWLAGNPDAITAHAQTWGNVANAVSAVGQDYTRAVSGDLTAWRGLAAQAYRARAADTGHLLEALTIAADGIRVAITMSGMVVATVRDQIQKMICDLVGYLIGYAAELVGSGGLAAPVVAEQAMSLIAQWAAKIAELISRLLRSIKALMPLLRHLDDILCTVAHGSVTNGAVPNGASPNGRAHR